MVVVRLAGRKLSDSLSNCSGTVSIESVFTFVGVTTAAIAFSKVFSNDVNFSSLEDLEEVVNEVGKMKMGVL